ncbi:MAG: tryptophan synthase subunit alpha [Leptolyngbya sp.]|nr:tryptophan synthase subunit alpha [Candidatus Melainabacteria bacterium]
MPSMSKSDKQNRYQARFLELRKSNKGAFMPFTVLGWPDEETSLRIMKSMIDSGASALELGIAFSDPVADGPIIQAAAHKVIESGFTVVQALKLVGRVRKLDGQIPIGLLVYYNHIMAMGIDEFFKCASEGGADGILVADLPAESADELLEAAQKHDICLIFIVSPLTKPERLIKVVEHAQGFIYLVSRLGVTGVDERNDTKDSRLSNLIADIRKATDLPILAGFGISTPAHARKMLDLGVDGVITGSNVINVVSRANTENPADLDRELKKYLVDMVSSLSPVKA